MPPAVMTIQQALATPITGMNVVIIGYPATGKTHFSRLLAERNPTHRLFHTDDYLLRYNGVEAMYACMGEVIEAIEAGTPTIVEGIAGYRMLRKGVQLGTYYPQIVFEMTAPLEQIERTYRTDPNRSADKVKNLAAFCKAQDTIKNQYLSIAGDFEFPTWITVENTF